MPRYGRFLTEALTLETNAKNYQDMGKSDKEQAYATLIEGMDKSLGDIVQHIRELDIGENTLVLFLGDNGSDAPIKIKDDYSSSTPLKGKKGNHWEGGMRVPFIASWVRPDEKNKYQRKYALAQNTIQTQMATILDIFPTICELSGVKIPKTHILDGDNLHKQLNGKRNARRNEVFLNHFPHGQHRSNYFTSLVKGDWKIIYHYPVNDEQRYELFNLKDDPFETHNLADKERDTLKQMARTLKAELKQKEALYPEKNGEGLEVIIP